MKYLFDISVVAAPSATSILFSRPVVTSEKVTIKFISVAYSGLNVFCRTHSFLYDTDTHFSIPVSIYTAVPQSRVTGGKCDIDWPSDYKLFIASTVHTSTTVYTLVGYDVE